MEVEPNSEEYIQFSNSEKGQNPLIENKAKLDVEDSEEGEISVEDGELLEVTDSPGRDLVKIDDRRSEFRSPDRYSSSGSRSPRRSRTRSRSPRRYSTSSSPSQYSRSSQSPRRSRTRSKSPRARSRSPRKLRKSRSRSPPKEIAVERVIEEPIIELFEREIDKHWKIMETIEGQADFSNWTTLLQMADKLSVCFQYIEYPTFCCLSFSSKSTSI